jgi:GT2 family glycosyltransferase
MTDAAAGIREVLAPAMPPSGTPTFARAVWVGTVDDTRFITGKQILGHLASYETVRLLVRSGRIPRGFLELPVINGAIDLAAATTAINALPPAPMPPARLDSPISVVLCTFDRPQMLRAALTSLLLMNYPNFEIIVVDNHPASGLTAAAVDAMDAPQIRLISEPRQGLARARNTGAVAASHSIVAFTDDDVVIDPQWLHGIADGFASGPEIGCVSGIVPSGEIGSVAQAYFDRRVTWARNCMPEIFTLSVPRPDEPLFPFQVGRYGTGANFAMRRDVLLEVGGFDEGLGIGSRAAGGEDIDMFVRVLLAGFGLSYQPSALVWHRHRADLDSLSTQIANYGTGLGAWLAKLALQPRVLAMMSRRVVPGIRHLRRVTQIDLPAAQLPPEVDQLWRVERKAVLFGPIALLRSRLSGAKARPLNRRNTPRVLHAARPSWAEQR